VLATVDGEGEPRLVPVCFVALDREPERGGSTDALRDAGWPVIYSPIDDKPKTGIDPLSLARVRDVLARPAVTLLVDRWDEDWTRLAWLRLHGTATLLDPSSEDAAAERAGAIVALRAKYPQYADHRLETRPIIRIAVTRASSWDATGTGIPTDRH
jgi:PPOX class probable F420-dependent enzyme